MAATEHATFEDLDEVFRPSDLVSAAGTADQGQRLVDTLAVTMPPDLEGVLNRRENLELGRRRDTRIPRKDHAELAKLVGLEGVKLADVTVRGGADEDGNNVDSEAAWVTFVYYDDRDDTLKGAVPYLIFTGDEKVDEEAGRRPILQSEALAKSAAARDHAEAQAKARAAAETEAQASGGMPNLAEAKASEVVAYLEEASPKEIEAVKAFEQALNGDTKAGPRKSIMEFEPEAGEEEQPAGDGGEEEQPAAGAPPAE